jgi:hypothetical protein
MSRAASVLLFCMVFACGVVAGLLADHMMEGHTIRSMNFASQDRPHVIEMVRDELALSDDQTRQVEKILDDASTQFNDLHKRAADVRANAKDQIRQVLNEQQRQKFEASMSKLQKVIQAGQ